MSDMFLTKAEVAELTGRKVRSLQIAQLRKMAIPFWVNALDAPVVPRSAIDGKKQVPAVPREKVIPHAYRDKVPDRS